MFIVSMRAVAVKHAPYVTVKPPCEFPPTENADTSDTHVAPVMHAGIGAANRVDVAPPGNEATT